MAEATGRLGGRRVLVTGAASGIGRAIAELFAREGARLALVDRTADALKAVSAALGALPLALDVSSENEVTAAVAKAAGELGGLDGVVNAAGIYQAIPLAETDYDTWRRFIDINLTGPYLICRAALPHLRAAGGGTIVNISSIGALQPAPGQSAYAASKGGLTAFTKALAAELGHEKIRANVICPGMIHSGITHGLYTPEKAEAVAAARTSLPRMGQPEEVAATALFLTGAESSYVTGSTVAVDGGRSYY
ncbi:SDR family NAD(P)-dependent oxidoreductase [Phenylobacterium sp.]|uniref:SDR family NAD(P)-dependent oxidoreductase n=1 Tax=Phenylobacterium sp. TaxID=1871053 RepID=UPI002F40103B